MLKQIPYKKIETVIENFLNSYPEDPIVLNLSHVRQKGFLNKGEFLEIGMWKSPRPKRFYEKNSPEKIKDITSKAFNSISESNKIRSLIQLHGVSIPTASAILAIVFPEKYGVIDIRVWQILYQYSIVNTKKEGVGFSIENWLDLTLILRNFSEKFGSTPRSIERALFSAHQYYQDGNLYKENK